MKQRKKNLSILIVWKFLMKCNEFLQNALMTFEDDKLQQAMLLLKDMERECAGDIGWLKSVKSKVFRAEETGVSISFNITIISFIINF